MGRESSLSQGRRTCYIADILNRDAIVVIFIEFSAFRGVLVGAADVELPVRLLYVMIFLPHLPRGLSFCAHWCGRLSQSYGRMGRRRSRLLLMRWATSPRQISRESFLLDHFRPTDWGLFSANGFPVNSVSASHLFTHCHSVDAEHRRLRCPGLPPPSRNLLPRILIRGCPL